MCTACCFTGNDHYMGRNLDLERSYGEGVVITPRRYPFRFADGTETADHLSIIGMAAIAEGYPLYFDGVNQAGLAMAGLNFPESARYAPPTDAVWGIAPYELIPRILCCCHTVAEGVALLQKREIVQVSFSKELPLTPLHWLLADRGRAVTVEATAQGLRIWDNPVKVLTNEPPFEEQMAFLRQFSSLSAEMPADRFAPELSLRPNSKGAGTWGLPGDLSSASRFVRATFTLWNATVGASEADNVGQCFHVLDAVAQVRGCNRTAEGLEITRYSACLNMDKGIYYYTTYDNRRITGVSLGDVPKTETRLYFHPITAPQDVAMRRATPVGEVFAAESQEN